MDILALQRAEVNRPSSRNLIPPATAAGLFWFTIDQFNRHRQAGRLPNPIAVLDGVQLYDRRELIAFRHAGCPRLDEWYYEHPDANRDGMVFAAKGGGA